MHKGTIHRHKVPIIIIIIIIIIITPMLTSAHLKHGVPDVRLPAVQVDAAWCRVERAQAEEGVEESGVAAEDNGRGRGLQGLGARYVRDKW